MADTKVRKNESIDDALRRFKRSVARDGTLAEIKKRKYYEKPSVKRKKKSEAARKKKASILTLFPSLQDKLGFIFILSTNLAFRRMIGGFFYGRPLF